MTNQASEDELDKYLFDTWNMKDTVHNRAMADGVKKWRKKHELQARIDENNRWRTILAPSDDYNTADMEDFNDRVVELKQELEKL